MSCFGLKRGDRVAIVSLSNGFLGEDFVKHELELGIKRLKEFGLVPVFMDNSLKGMEYLKNHPEARVHDLKQAFMDKDIKMIMSAIGGEDTYKTIPYLMEDLEFIQSVKNNPKIFTGFSDTTMNHLMLNKLGLSTFYGPAFLVDIAELDNDMLDYTKEYFLKIFDDNDVIEITSSPVWYENRKSFDETQLGVPRKSFKEIRGYETLNGHGVVVGKLYGGCINTIYDALTGERYHEEDKIFEKYNLLPSLEEWKEKILFLETSEEIITPEKLRLFLLELKKRDILDSVKGLLIGKPVDEIYYNEYKEVYKEFFKDSILPIMYNINFGHASPRCFLQYDAEATVDYDKKIIRVRSCNLLNDNKSIK